MDMSAGMYICGAVHLLVSIAVAPVRKQVASHNSAPVADAALVPRGQGERGTRQVLHAVTKSSMQDTLGKTDGHIHGNAQVLQCTPADQRSRRLGLQTGGAPQ